MLQILYSPRNIPFMGLFDGMLLLIHNLFPLAFKYLKVHACPNIKFEN